MRRGEFVKYNGWKIYVYYDLVDWSKPEPLLVEASNIFRSGWCKSGGVL